MMELPGNEVYSVRGCGQRRLGLTSPGVKTARLSESNLLKQVEGLNRL